MKSVNAIVRLLLASRLDRDVSTIRSGLELDALGLTPLDLVLIALDVEEATGVCMSMHELGSVGTVGELISCLSMGVVRERRVGATEART